MPHIQGYKIIPLNELMAQLDKERVTAILSSFSSPMNRDVELFLKQKAVTFDTQSISRTHLVFTSYKEQTVLAGYFTLAYKDFTIPAKNVGRSLRDRIKKFGSYDFETKAYKISAPLIAQLSKNFTDGYNKLISGDELLTMALRAKITRPTLVSEMIDYMQNFNPSETEFIETAAFIIGEYSSEMESENEEEESPEESGFNSLISDTILRTDPSAQAACIQNAFKIYAKSKTQEELQKRSKILLEKLPLYSTSRFTEVQERATMLLALVNIFSEQNDIEALSSLYSMPLPAVDASAQGKVTIPSTLDIATPIIELEPHSYDEFGKCSYCGYQKEIND